MINRGGGRGGGERGRRREGGRVISRVKLFTQREKRRGGAGRVGRARRGAGRRGGQEEKMRGREGGLPGEGLSAEDVTFPGRLARFQRFSRRRLAARIIS